MMSAVVIELSDQDDDEFKGLDIVLKLLYWQGIWVDENNPDLEYYIPYYNSQQARQFLQEHPYHKWGLKSLPKCFFWTMAVVLSLECFVRLPICMYTIWDNTEEVMPVIYVTIFNYIILSGFFSAKFKRTDINKMICALKNLSRTRHLDNEDQKRIRDRAHSFYMKLLKALVGVAFPISVVVIVLLACFFLLPQRKHFQREWFPWDPYASPFYEIYLVFNSIKAMAVMLIVYTLVGSFAIIFLYLYVFFKILLNKIENIHPIAVARVKRYQSESKHKLTQDISRSVFGSLINVVSREQTRSLRQNRGVGMRVMTRSPQTFKVDPVGNTLQNQEQTDRTLTTALLEKEILRVLHEIIEYHSRVLTYANVIASFADEFFVVMFLGTIVILAQTTATLAQGEHLTAIDYAYMVEALEVVLVYLAINVLANTMSEQSEEVGLAVYNMEWPERSTAFKKSMIIIMSRANDPLLFKPTGLDPVSNKNFTEVTKIAYNTASSLFSVVN